MRHMGERLSPAGVAMIVIAVAVLGWIGYELSKWPEDPPQSTSSTATVAEDTDPTPSASPTAPVEPQQVALLSDGLAITVGSWFNRTIRDGSLEGAVPGAVASQAGLGAADLAPRAELAARADVLVVQAGTIDLLNGTAPDEVVTDLQDLLQTAIDLGGPDGGPEVLWVTVPPLGARPADVLTVNRAMTTWAERNDVTVWNLTSPVATRSGAWRPGFTPDGIGPSVEGQQAQARAARALAEETLPALAAG